MRGAPTTEETGSAVWYRCVQPSCETVLVVWPIGRADDNGGRGGGGALPEAAEGEATIAELTEPKAVAVLM